MKLPKVKLVVAIEPDTPIHEAATEMIDLAKRLGAALTFEFGGTWWTVTGTDRPADLVRQLEEKAKEMQATRWPPRPVRRNRK